MKYYEFDSKVKIWEKPIPDFDQETIKNEPMFFNADMQFVAQNCGPITRAVLNHVLDGCDDIPVVFDSRVHMLMPGWLPAIPGWHHDDVPRTAANGQPDYDAPAYRSRHAMVLINGDVAPTEFALGQHSLLMPEDTSVPLYGVWHSIVESQIAQAQLERIAAPSNRVIEFDWQSMHRAVPAIKSGWRWFGRFSWQTERKPTNEIRRQVQVYLNALNEGW